MQSFESESEYGMEKGGLAVEALGSGMLAKAALQRAVALLEPG